MILAFFGGLRHTETMDLKLEKFCSTSEGVSITHSRAKQRSDKRDSKFLIPRSGETNFAEIVEMYIGAVKSDLGKFSGRVLWTGKDFNFVNIPMGKNIVCLVPRDMAKFLKKDEVNSFTFHSCRRSSATAAADSGASPQQMMDFFGWQNPSMPQQYISTSKSAIKTMANHLQPAGLEECSKSNVSSVPAPIQPSFIDSSNLETHGKTKNEKVIFIQNFNGTINM